MYRPDVAGWRRERLPELPASSPLLVRPDWVCEILSPSNEGNDVVKKMRAYKRSSVPHDWLISSVVRREEESYDCRVPDPEPDDSSALQHLATTLKRVEELLQFLPDGAAKNLVTKMGVLRGLLLERRPPALVLVGRRGAGKSSLVNALFGARVAEVGHVEAQTGRGRWYEFKGERGTLSVLDTRGLQEGGRPKEEDDSPNALASLSFEIKKKHADGLVFVVKASEVDSAIDADLDGLERVFAEVLRAHRFHAPVAAVITHCDLLEPKATRLHARESEPESEVEEKLALVSLAESLLEQKLRARPAIAAHVVGVRGASTYLSFHKDGAVRADERWNMDAVVALLFALLPNAGRGTFVRIARVRALQEELATTLTQATAAVCAGIAAVPIPVADVVPITSLQVSLVWAIAWLSGRTLEKKSAAEFVASLGINVGVAFALREGARALVKFVFPGGGSAVSGAVAFAGTLAIGAAARAYYLRGESLDDAKKAMGQEFPDEP